MRRALFALIITAFVAALGPTFPARAEGALADRPDLARRLFDLTNAERRARGIHTLSWHSPMVPVARAHAARMANHGDIFHNEGLRQEVYRLDATVIGENVGVSASIPGVHAAFMASPTHRANVLDRDYRSAGFAVLADDLGTLWITENFITLRARRAPAPPRPRPARPNAAPAPPPAVPRGSEATAATDPEANRLLGSVSGFAPAAPAGTPVAARASLPAPLEAGGWFALGVVGLLAARGRRRLLTRR